MQKVNLGRWWRLDFMCNIRRPLSLQSLSSVDLLACKAWARRRFCGGKRLQSIYVSSTSPIFGQQNGNGHKCKIIVFPWNIFTLLRSLSISSFKMVARLCDIPIRSPLKYTCSAGYRALKTWFLWFGQVTQVSFQSGWYGCWRVDISNFQLLLTRSL